MAGVRRPWRATTAEEREEAHRRRASARRRKYVLTGVVAVVVLALAGATCAAYAERHTTEVVVTDKERVCSGGDRTDCKYLVFTDGTTYRVQDSLLAGRLTSSDFYGRIKVCHRYRITYYGFRFGLTSSYPNLTEADDLGRAEGCETP